MATGLTLLDRLPLELRLKIYDFHLSDIYGPDQIIDGFDKEDAVLDSLSQVPGPMGDEVLVLVVYPHCTFVVDEAIDVRAREKIKQWRKKIAGRYNSDLEKMQYVAFRFYPYCPNQWELTKEFEDSYEGLRALRRLFSGVKRMHVHFDYSCWDEMIRKWTGAIFRAYLWALLDVKEVRLQMFANYDGSVIMHKLTDCLPANMMFVPESASELLNNMDEEEGELSFEDLNGEAGEEREEIIKRRRMVF